MYYFSGLLAAALFAVAGAVRFDLPPGGLSPIEGQPIQISYSQAEGPVTITLKNGPVGDLQTVDVIGDGPAGEGSITWTPEGLPSGTYALEIQDGSGINYSNSFSYQGTGPINTTAPTEPDTTTPTNAATPTTPAVTSPTNTTLDTTTADTTTNTTDATPTTTEDAATTTEPINQNDQNNANPRLGSSMALVLGAAALLAIFN